MFLKVAARKNLRKSSETLVMELSFKVSGCDFTIKGIMVFWGEF